MGDVFDEEEHPRWPKGDPRGGQFAPKGSAAPSSGVEVERKRRVVELSRGKYKQLFSYQLKKIPLHEQRAIGQYRDGKMPTYLRMSEE